MLLVGRIKEEIIQRSRAIRAALARMDADIIRIRKFEAQGGLCHICTKPIQNATGFFCHVGHAITVYMWAEQRISLEETIAGANAEKNLVALHPECNSRQQAIDLEEFLERVKDGELALGELKTLTAEDLERVKAERSARFSAACKKRAATMGRVRLLAAAKKAMRTMGPERLSARAKKRNENLGPEQLSAAAVKGKETMGPERRSAAVKKANETRGLEGRSAAVRKAKETMGRERLSTAGRKAAATVGHERLSLNAKRRWVQDDIRQKVVAAVKKHKQLMGPERLSAAAKKGKETMGPERRSNAGRKGNHTRYHVKRGISSPETCLLCRVGAASC
jgi:hypothetical protein